MAPAAAIPLPYTHDPFLLVQHALASRWLDPVMIAASWACEGWVLALLAIAVASIAARGRLPAAIPFALLAAPTPGRGPAGRPGARGASAGVEG